MQLKDIVCDLEYAKRLKELGIKQDTLFSFTTYTKKFNEAYHVSVVESKILETYEGINTFTTDELLEMLPPHLSYDRFGINSFDIGKFNDGVGYISGYFDDDYTMIKFIDNKLPNTSAQLLIWCIENGHTNLKLN